MRELIYEFKIRILTWNFIFFGLPTCFTHAVFMLYEKLIPFPHVCFSLHSSTGTVNWMSG